ncbi:putative N-acetyltransferase [Gracilariopsis chorda]|uniref:Putative N-acetyltransferase n=1 Tax=Gracilariopsis chorda TaxID=448386 RepID=A0A2V3IUQ9_9FLOR|nr:putative N-acetyltransferase [Gracilariopsis chorda]|eukprot:PXF45851.1 putative N-acetyltransferase [Gracilariopsis chorda]
MNSAQNTELTKERPNGIELELRKMQASHIPAVHSLEKDSYPSDEAASKATLDYRMAVAEPLCQIAVDSGTSELVGFVSATATSKNTERMTASMLKEHSSTGEVVCIHSVVVDKKFRRRGYGTEMMKAYMSKVEKLPQYNRILLISKRYLVPFYESVGFREMGESDIAHGKERWIDMERILRHK